MKPKIFQMNDFDWVVAYSLSGAKKWYRHWCIDECRMLPDDVEMQDAKELTQEQMDIAVFIDDDDGDMSFSEQLNRLIERKIKFPYFFASTEW